MFMGEPRRRAAIWVIAGGRVSVPRESAKSWLGDELAGLRHACVNW
jgi:hypothetical protein